MAESNIARIEARTDGPVPLSCRIDENGIKYCTWEPKELRSYVQKNPDVVFVVKDGEGNFFKYQNTKVVWDAMVSGELPA
jgi:hypothetical protein